MTHPPLTRTMRLRVWVVTICSGLLVVLIVPLVVVTMVSGKGSTRASLGLLAIGVGLPVIFLLGLWWQIRRYRTNPDVRRRQPHGKAARTLLVGNLISLFLANVARDLVPPGGWRSLLIGLGVAVAGSSATFHLARQHDDRLRWFHRPALLPEGEEPRDEEPKGRLA